MKYNFIYLITIAGLLTITSCTHKKERTMERYDFEYMEKVKAEAGRPFDGFKQKDDMLIFMRLRKSWGYQRLTKLR